MSLINKSEFSELMEKFEFSQKVRCSKEETEKFNKALKANELLPKGVDFEGDGEYKYFFRQRETDLTDKEISRFLNMKIFKTLSVIKNCVIFFTILILINIFLSIMIALM